MQKIKIRSAKQEDIKKLLEFEQGIILAERPFDVTLKPGQISYYDIPKLITSENSQLLLAEKEGQIVGSGYARLEKAKEYHRFEQYAYLGMMYVDPVSRGQGINKLVIDGLMEWSKAKGMTEVRLDVYTENAGAIRAYEKVGFSKHMVEMRKEI